MAGLEQGKPEAWDVLREKVLPVVPVGAPHKIRPFAEMEYEYLKDVHMTLGHYVAQYPTGHPLRTALLRLTIALNGTLEIYRLASPPVYVAVPQEGLDG